MFHSPPKITEKSLGKFYLRDILQESLVILGYLDRPLHNKDIYDLKCKKNDALQVINLFSQKCNGIKKAGMYSYLNSIFVC